MMQFRIEIAGDVVERQELLNGTETVTIEGADAGAVWILTGSFSWNIGLVDYAGEGDLVLTRNAGSEIFGTLLSADVSVAPDEGDADYAFRLAYEIDGGTGDFEGVAGSASAEGTLAGNAFRAVWTLALSGT